MRFVVGYVPDRRGKDAVNLATTLAGAREAVLDIVVVLPVDEASLDMYSPDRAYQAELEKNGEEWLARALAHVPEGVQATGRVCRAASITEGLIEAAAASEAGGDAGSEAEAIVVGASHRGVLGEMLIGSIASSLLHSAPVPVALAPAGYEPSASVTRITCAIGEREGAEALLDTAIQAAAVRDIPLRLVSLVALDPDPSADSQDSRVEAAQEHVERLVARAREALPSADVSGTVGSGHTLEECVTSLEFEPSEFVLLGSSRLAASHRVFLSATAHRISRALSVPMVVIPRDHVAPVVN
ncbi:MAG: universal stress protein [Tetrasphaera jenkinsii]|jgi:nucleotide-binding universal stress UspA family protein|uniref:Universal stress protein family n=1 Tax=Nostocoides jenkinsii Ben 74 TaxID=1193518 RepID=A0A077M8P5_9MICO|nr:universal stress protein [Tetrasphaera jenkinsii]MCI1261267.1 universal stress protein [Tetrasphaera jenkinsii]CCI52934.1 Universal stress protein family [Tetrasphaera jenkinsii Ben 74]